MDLLAADEVLARDIHPAEVLMPDGALVSGARVFITSHRIIAWVAGTDRRVEVRLQAPLMEARSVEPSMNDLGVNERLAVELESGTAFVNRGRGCGCGSPLKALAAPVPWTHGRNSA